MAKRSAPKPPRVALGLTILETTDEKLRETAEAMQVTATGLIRAAIEHLLDDPGHALGALADKDRG